MTCAYHPSVESAAFCVSCGKALCAPCRRAVENAVYCDGCLSEIVQLGLGRQRSSEAESADRPSQERASGGPPPASAPPKSENPGIAFALGLIPGVGAVYNGEFFKAAAHIVTFAVLIQFAEAGPPGNGVFVLLAVAFYFYMPFEAYFTAKKRSLRSAGIDLETPIDRLHQQFDGIRNKELWGGLGMVAVGIVFLADSLGILPLRWVAPYWPALLIIFGVWLVVKRRRSGGASGSGAGASTSGDRANSDDWRDA